MTAKGIPKTTLQRTVSFSIPSFDEGSAKPLIRQIVLPKTIPRPAVVANVGFFSYGKVSARYIELATNVTPALNA